MRPFRLHLSLTFSYVAIDQTIDDPEQLFNFWRDKQTDPRLSAWAEVAMLIATLPTSSGAVERLVSVFTAVTGDQMLHQKEETIEVRCLVKYNNRVPARRRKHRFDDNCPPELLQPQDQSESEEEHWEEEVIEEGE